MSWYSHLTLAQADPRPAPAGPASQPAPAGETQTTEGQAVSPNGEPPVEVQKTPPPIGFFMIIGFILLMWFMIFLPQRREKKKHAAMLGQLKKGDRIQTIGGILGTIVELRDREVIVKVDEASNARMRFTRGAIQGVVEESKSE